MPTVFTLYEINKQWLRLSILLRYSHVNLLSGRYLNVKWPPFESLLTSIALLDRSDHEVVRLNIGSDLLVSHASPHYQGMSGGNIGFIGTTVEIWNPTIQNLGPHSICPLKEIPVLLNFGLQNNIRKVYFPLIFSFLVCYFNWGLAIRSKNCNFKSNA